MINYGGINGRLILIDWDLIKTFWLTNQAEIFRATEDRLLESIPSA